MDILLQQQKSINYTIPKNPWNKLIIAHKTVLTFKTRVQTDLFLNLTMLLIEKCKKKNHACIQSYVYATKNSNDKTYSKQTQLFPAVETGKEENENEIKHNECELELRRNGTRLILRAKNNSLPCPQ